MANIITGELVEPVRRTAVFGQLQGTIMLGQGIGYLGICSRSFTLPSVPSTEVSRLMKDIFQSEAC